MKRNLAISIFIVLGLTSMVQGQMRKIEELANKELSSWSTVKLMIDSAKNKIEILPCDTAKAAIALYKTQVSTRSPMGAIIYNTGGLLIENGWIRMLGAGHDKLNRSLPDWNTGKSFKEVGEKPAFLLIADDVIGGFFALNGGALGKDLGKVYYLAPDNLKWEALDYTYTEFLDFCFNGNLAMFYEGLGWKALRSDYVKLNGNQVYNFVPPLWSKQGKDISKNEKAAIPIEEQYQYNMKLRKQLGLDKAQ